MKLDHVSTRELLHTLARRGASAKVTGERADGEHLEADAKHLLKCLSSEVLDYPYAEVSR